MCHSKSNKYAVNECSICLSLNLLYSTRFVHYKYKLTCVKVWGRGAGYLYMEVYTSRDYGAIITNK